jgi:hypothetical protein
VRFYRYKIKPTIRRRTIIDERLIIIQPHIGMRARIDKNEKYINN